VLCVLINAHAFEFIGTVRLSESLHETFRPGELFALKWRCFELDSVKDQQAQMRHSNAQTTMNVCLLRSFHGASGRL